jgi:hypothetical protein
MPPLPLKEQLRRGRLLEAASGAVVIKSESTVISSLGNAKNNYDARAPSRAVRDGVDHKT